MLMNLLKLALEGVVSEIIHVSVYDCTSNCFNSCRNTFCCNPGGSEKS